MVMTSKKNLAKWLPWLLALFAGFVVSVHYFATLEASARLTNVSSTFAIAYLYIPFLFVIAGLFGLLLGFILRALLQRFGWLPEWSVRRSLVITLVATLVVSALAWALGTYQVAAFVEANKPQVLLNQYEFETRPLESEDHRLIPAVRSFVRMEHETAETYEWNGEAVSVDVAEDDELQLQTARGTLARMRPGYFIGVDIIDLSNAEGDEFIATLVQHRGTSRRFTLYIHEPYGDLVYEETLEGCSARQPILMSRIEFEDGQALVIDQCEEKLIVP